MRQLIYFVQCFKFFLALNDLFARNLVRTYLVNTRCKDRAVTVFSFSHQGGKERKAEMKAAAEPKKINKTSRLCETVKEPEACRSSGEANNKRAGE